MSAASQLAGGERTDVDDAPAITLFKYLNADDNEYANEIILYRPTG